MSWTDVSLSGTGTIPNRLKNYSYFNELEDDGTTSLPPSENGGFGFAQIGDGEEYGFFSFTSGGAVTLINYSSNTVDSDTDNKFCIYNNGGLVEFKNRLGSSKYIMILAFYE